MTVQEQLRDLLKRYCTNLFDQVEMLEQLILRSCDVSAQSSAPISKARDITHQMKGTSGSMGFPDLAAAASALDDHLKLLAKQERVSQLQLQISKELFVRLRKIASQITPQKSALFNADLSASSQTARY